MATAGYSSRLFVTTTDTSPSTSDLVGEVQSVSWNPTKAKLDTGVLGEAFQKSMQGKSGNEPSISALYAPSDTGQGRLITAFTSGATVYLHWDPLGTGACQKVGVKVFGYPQKTDQAGLVTAEYTVSGCTALGTSTVS